MRPSRSDRTTLNPIAEAAEGPGADRSSSSLSRRGGSNASETQMTSLRQDSATSDASATAAITVEWRPTTSLDPKVAAEAAKRDMQLARVAGWAAPFSLDLDLFAQQSDGQTYGAGRCRLGLRTSRVVSLLVAAWPLYAAFWPVVSTVFVHMPLQADNCGVFGNPNVTVPLALCLKCNYGLDYVVVSPGYTDTSVMWSLTMSGISLMYTTLYGAFTTRDRTLLMAARGVHTTELMQSRWMLGAVISLVLLVLTCAVYAKVLAFLKVFSSAYVGNQAVEACLGVYVAAVLQPRLPSVQTFYLSDAAEVVSSILPMLLAVYKILTMVSSPFDVIGSTNMVQNKEFAFKYFSGVRYGIKAADMERMIVRLAGRIPGTRAGSCSSPKRYFASFKYARLLSPPTVDHVDQDFYMAALVEARARGLISRLPVNNAPRSVPLPVSEPVTKEQIRRIWLLLLDCDSMALTKDPEPILGDDSPVV